MKKSVLIVDDEEHIRNHLGEFLEEDGYMVYTASTIENAKQEIQNKELHYAIIDLKLDNPSEYGGIEVYKCVKENKPDVIPIILSAYFNEHVKEELKKEEKDIEPHYIFKGGEQNYILAVLDKLEELEKE